MEEKEIGGNKRWGTEGFVMERPENRKWYGGTESGKTGQEMETQQRNGHKKRFIICCVPAFCRHMGVCRTFMIEMPL